MCANQLAAATLEVMGGLLDGRRRTLSRLSSFLQERALVRVCAWRCHSRAATATDEAKRAHARFYLLRKSQSNKCVWREFIAY